MNQLLQDAINATRAGNKKEAQWLLVQNLEAHPDDAQSWYLLSLLVDSPEKQALYLNKTLALEPDHPQAQARFSAMSGTAVSAPEAEPVGEATAVAVAISDDPDNFIAQEKGDTLPEWLAGDADALQVADAGIRLDSAEMEAEGAEGEEAAASSVVEELPSWLQSDVPETWTSPEMPTQISPAAPEPEAADRKTAAAQTKPTPKPKTSRKRKPKKPRTKKQQKDQLNLVLGGLIVVMVIVFILLIMYVTTLN